MVHGCERYGPVSRTMGFFDGFGVPGVAPGCILAPVPRSGNGGTFPVASDPGWTAQATARGTERDPCHTIGQVVGRLRRGCPTAAFPIFEQSELVLLLGRLSKRTAASLALKGAVHELPANSGIGLANCRTGRWSASNVSGARFWYQLESQLVPDSIPRRRDSPSNAGPRHGLLKADHGETGGRSWRSPAACRHFRLPEGRLQTLFFADEAHFRADAGSSGQAWCPEGRHPALGTRAAQEVRRVQGQLLFGGVLWRPARWNRWSWRGPTQPNFGSLLLGHVAGGGTDRSSERDPGTTAGHRGQAVREYLRTPGLNLRLFNRCQPTVRQFNARSGTSGAEAQGGVVTGNSVPGCQNAVQGPGGFRGWQSHPLVFWPDVGKKRCEAPLPARSCNQGPAPGCASHSRLSTPRGQLFTLASWLSS